MEEKKVVAVRRRRRRRSRRRRRRRRRRRGEQIEGMRRYVCYLEVKHVGCIEPAEVVSVHKLAEQFKCFIFLLCLCGGNNKRESCDFHVTTPLIIF